jgi:signal transduction histidine kinase
LGGEGVLFRIGGAKRCIWACLFVRLAIVVCLAVMPRLAAADSAGDSQGFVGGSADHLVDRDGTLTLADVIEQHFIPADGKPANYGLSARHHMAFWLRLKIDRLPRDEEDWVLSLREPRTRSLQLFAVDGDGSTTLERTWRRADPPPITPYPVVSLSRSDLLGRTLYLRVQTVSSMRASLWLEPASRFLGDYSGEALYFGALLGMLVTLAVYCAATGAAVGDVTLMLLAGMTVSIAAYIAGDRGLVESAIWPGRIVLSRIISLGGTLMIYATAVPFSAAFLQAPLRNRWTRIGVFALAALFTASAVAATLDVFMEDRTNVLRYSPWLGLLAIVAILGMGLACVLFEPRRAGLFLLCWSPALLTGLTRIGLNLFPGVLPARPATVGLVYLGITTSSLLFAVVTSIELRKRALVARAERAANERRFRDFAITASDDFWEADGNLIVTRTFQGGSPVVALSAGKPLLAELAALGVDVAQLQSVLDNKAAFRDVRLRISHGEPSERYLSLSGLPVLAADHSFIGWRGTLTDVSEQVAREWEHGHQRVLAALGFLVGSIAHDVNNLLHPVLNLSRRVGESLERGDPRIRLLGVVTESAHQAAQIVASVLGLARSRSDSRMVPFGTAVLDSIKLIKGVSATGVRLVADVETKDGPMVAETDVFRILANLVTNAAAAMNNTGEVHVSFREQHDHSFLLEVSDCGPGMSDATRKILQESEGDVPGGTRRSGLGLMIVGHIVKSLDGLMEIRSNSSGGATVALKFPAVHAAVPAVVS